MPAASEQIFEVGPVGCKASDVLPGMILYKDRKDFAPSQEFKNFARAAARPSLAIKDLRNPVRDFEKAIKAVTEVRAYLPEHAQGLISVPRQA